jgi:hypothetical protein
MLKIKTPWEEVKEKIKEANVELTDADLNYNEDQEKQLLEHLAKKMQKSPKK